MANNQQTTIDQLTDLQLIEAIYARRSKAQTLTAEISALEAELFKRIDETKTQPTNQPG